MNKQIMYNPDLNATEEWHEPTPIYKCDICFEESEDENEFEFRGRETYCKICTQSTDFNYFKLKNKQKWK